MSVSDENTGDEVFEKAEQEVMSYLPEMSEEKLKALLGDLGVEIPGDKQGRKKLYRLVLGYLLEIEEQHEDGGKAKYIQIHGFLHRLAIEKVPQTPVSTVEMTTPAVSNTTRALPETPKDEIEQKADVSSAHSSLYQNMGTLEGKGGVGKPKAANLYHLKECKIRGSIGDPGEKEKLDYYGLLSQINAHKREGYDDDRIVAAVIIAMTPGNVFKNRLEMRRNLEGSISLETLLNMLRIHYQERDSDSILQNLKEAIQEPSETVAQFVNKLMVIRDQALSRSMEEGCKLEMKNLRKRFYKSVITGMRNGNLRNELREGLKREPTDDELLDQIADAVRNEAERSGKFTGPKIPEVSVIQREKNDFQRSVCEKEKKLEKRIDDMKVTHQNEIVSMRAEIGEIKNILKTGFSNLAAPIPQNSTSNPPPPNPVQPVQQQHPPASGGTQHPPQNYSFGQPSHFGQPPTMPAPYVIPQMRSQPMLQPSAGQSPAYMSPQGSRFRKCGNCVSQNIPRCNHCLYCGQSGHQISVCPQQRSRLDAQNNQNNRPPANPQPLPTLPAQAAILSTNLQPAATSYVHPASHQQQQPASLLQL